MLPTHIRRIEIKSVPELTPLQLALLKSGVKILDEDDVRDYKAEKLAEAKTNRNFFQKLLAFFAGRRVKGLEFRSNSPIEWREYSVGSCQDGDLTLREKFVAPGMSQSTTIPGEVLDVCERIAKTGVCAEFIVQQLDADPFMTVQQDRIGERGPEYYYVASWDEGGFIG